MHPALRLEEIILNILYQCSSQPPIDTLCRCHSTADLAALARTCRTFKELALDVLWTVLDNLSPLARCLPEASHQVHDYGNPWKFSRPLKQAEWDTLRNYARRVRSVLDFPKGLNWDSVKTLFNPPTPDPMFPNLRALRWEFTRETFPLMHHLTVPSLTSLGIQFSYRDVPPFHSFPHSLGDLCPNMRSFSVCPGSRPQIGDDETISALVCRWGNLRVLYCPNINLDSDALSHLSRTHSLTSLSFTLNAMAVDHITSSNTILLFSSIRALDISCQSLESVSRLISYIRLPAIETLSIDMDSRPSMYIVRSFLTEVEKKCNHHSLTSLSLTQTTRSFISTYHESDLYHLTFDDIRPCMAFDQLRYLGIDIASAVSLSDDDLLSLAYACHRMEHLIINQKWGWKSGRGITPDGLLQILQILKSLCRFCLAIDTRGYTRPSPALQHVRNAGLIPRMQSSVNVADSPIQPESVDALADFFASIGKFEPLTFSHYWSISSTMAVHVDSDISKKLWMEVFTKAYEKAKAFSDDRALHDDPR